jgi:hypothetical protein
VCACLVPPVLHVMVLPARLVLHVTCTSPVQKLLKMRSVSMLHEMYHQTCICNGMAETVLHI